MPKVQRNYKYHSKWLIPEKIAIDAKQQKSEEATLEVILLWQDAYQSSHHFKEGDTAYHIDDLETPLRVDKILRSYPKPTNGEKQKSKIIGIQVHWHETV
jgi:hypothetical protein